MMRASLGNRDGNRRGCSAAADPDQDTTPSFGSQTIPPVPDLPPEALIPKPFWGLRKDCGTNPSTTQPYYTKGAWAESADCTDEPCGSAWVQVSHRRRGTGYNQEFLFDHTWRVEYHYAVCNGDKHDARNFTSDREGNYSCDSSQPQWRQ